MWDHGRGSQGRFSPEQRACAQRTAGPGRHRFDARVTVRRSPRFCADRGAATAEFAMVMPALILVIVVVLGAAAIGLGQLRAYEAARAGAREAARGEDTAQVEKSARHKAGKGSSVGVKQNGEYTVVQVSVPLPHSLHFVRKAVRAEAEARTESGATEGTAP